VGATKAQNEHCEDEEITSCRSLMSNFDAATHHRDSCHFLVTPHRVPSFSFLVGARRLSRSSRRRAAIFDSRRTCSEFLVFFWILGVDPLSHSAFHTLYDLEFVVLEQRS